MAIMNGLAPRRELLSLGPEALPGEFAWPDQALGLVLFVPDAQAGPPGSTARHLSAVLQQHRLATLLLELPRPEDGAQGEAAGLIERSTARLLAVLDCLRDTPPRHWRQEARLARSSVGLVGTGCGMAAVLQVAAQRSARVNAVVSHGGGTWAAAPYLRQVQAPTLLIVGGAEPELSRQTRRMAEHLGGAHRVEVVPGSDHRFEEPGALDTLTALVAQWLRRHAGREAL